jgi:hypothetical protein
VPGVRQGVAVPHYARGAHECAVRNIGMRGVGRVGRSGVSVTKAGWVPCERIGRPNTVVAHYIEPACGGRSRCGTVHVLPEVERHDWGIALPRWRGVWVCIKCANLTAHDAAGRLLTALRVPVADRER